MKVSDRMIEAVEAMVEQEREEEIARIRAGLAEEGEDFCIDCDAPIGAARKAALPSAERRAYLIAEADAAFGRLFASL